LESTKLTAAIALTINIRPTTEVTFIGSNSNTAELRRPITGTSNSVNDVVIAGKVRATVIKAQNGKAVISGPL
jgi:hypothetical protein